MDRRRLLSGASGVAAAVGVLALTGGSPAAASGRGRSTRPLQVTGDPPATLDDLTDVDTSTTPPASGDGLLFNGSLWVPAGVATRQELDAHVNNAADAHDASTISVVPTNEMVATDVQSALAQLDLRTRIDAFLDDQVVALTIVERFTNQTSTNAQHGREGWSHSLSGTGALVSPVSRLFTTTTGGGRILQTGTTASGKASLNLQRIVAGSPVMVCEWRARLVALNDAADQYTARLGLTNGTGTATPTDGLWFEYTSSGGANWRARARNNGGTTTTVNTGVPADVAYHRFRIVVDGGGTAMFFVDDMSVPRATLTSGLPASPRQTGPVAAIAKNLGTKDRALVVSWFLARIEQLPTDDHR